MKDIQVSFEGLADIITGYAGKVGATFPFVTLPLFEVQAEHTRQASHAEVLTYAPFVAEEERKEWEAFAWKNQQWIKNSRDISLMGQGNLEWSQYLDAPISDIIYEHEKPEPPFVQIPAVHSPFLPAWHVREIIIQYKNRWSGVGQNRIHLTLAFLSYRLRLLPFFLVL